MGASTFVCAIKLPHTNLSTFYTKLNACYHNIKINEDIFILIVNWIEIKHSYKCL